MIELSGQVERVYFSASGYSAFALRVGERRVRVAGQIQVQEGDRLSGTFALQEHPRFGPQYAPLKVAVIPSQADTAGLVAFLARRVWGLGGAKARAIVEHFGADTPAAMDSPLLLRSVPGIGGRAEAISESWQEVKGEYAAMARLYTLGLSSSQAERATRHFGPNAYEVLSADIYRLAEIPGLGFKMADRIALERGVDPQSPARLRAAAVYALEECLAEGHTAPSHERVLKAGERTGLAAENLNEGLRLALAEGAAEESGGRWGLKGVWKAEQEVAQRVEALNQKTPLEKPLVAPEGLTEEQAAVFAWLSEGRITALTGGPGVGKTHTLAALVKAVAEAGLSLALAAPTGKAAKRMSELARYPAATLHRLLGFDPEQGGFIYGERCPLPYDVIILDECSMVDIWLMRDFLRAIGPRTRVLLVGDPDQLPPVGPGAPFADLLERIPTVRLTRIFRQAQGNPIVRAAHRINQGRPPAFDDDPRLRLIEADDPEAVRQQVPSLIRALEDATGARPPVITPMHDGPIGVIALNAFLKSIFNPVQGPGCAIGGGYEAQPGDPVIQTRNDYEVNLMNGEQAVVLETGQDGLLLRTDEREIWLKAKQARSLHLAYALTVHKCQGSQWPGVLIVAHTAHYVMLTRELVYTALTRAEQAAWMVGTPKALALAARRQASRRETLRP